MISPRDANKNFFLEQWHRVERWKVRCDESPNLDFYEAFFINSYHLKDWLTQWLKINNRHGLIKLINKDFKYKDELKCLKDLCNGSKHFTLTQNPAIGKQYTILRTYSLGKIRSTIFIGGKQFDVKDLTEYIYHYWDGILKKNNLDQLEDDLSGNPFPFD